MIIIKHSVDHEKTATAHDIQGYAQRGGGGPQTAPWIILIEQRKEQNLYTVFLENGSLRSP